jgi:quercetin dioxygenase-like cupin family protein
MQYGDATVIEDLSTLALRRTAQPIYDQPIGSRALYVDEGSGTEHYLIRYPAGMVARPHRHTAAHTIVVLEGRLAVNGRVVEAFSYVHFPAGEVMHHAPADGASCLFVIIFDGRFDVELVDS